MHVLTEKYLKWKQSSLDTYLTAFRPFIIRYILHSVYSNEHPVWHFHSNLGIINQTNCMLSLENQDARKMKVTYQYSLGAPYSSTSPPDTSQ
jgi:hypothetical protein